LDKRESLARYFTAFALFFLDIFFPQDKNPELARRSSDLLLESVTLSGKQILKKEEVITLKKNKNNNENNETKRFVK
jgi:hypothetical protein